MATGKPKRENVEDVWRYCSVCRRNHDEGRKHIFTKQHKNRLSVIMSKFTKKVQRAIPLYRHTPSTEESLGRRLGYVMVTSTVACLKQAAKCELLHNQGQL